MEDDIENPVHALDGPVSANRFREFLHARFATDDVEADVAGLLVAVIRVGDDLTDGGQPVPLLCEVFQGFRQRGNQVVTFLKPSPRRSTVKCCRQS